MPSEIRCEAMTCWFTSWARFIASSGGVWPVAALQAQVKTTQETLELSTASYKDGASSLLDVLDAQRQVSLAQASLAQSVQQMAKDYVSLNIAIGGGYAPDGKIAAPVKPAPAKPAKS